MAKVSVSPRDDEEIRNVSDLLKVIKKLRASLDGRRICFRGHANIKWQLIPPIGRPRYFGGKPIEFGKQEEKNQLLHRFRRATYLSHHRILSEWEALFLGRHHGLPVRLLDWTFNPLAALYFACESVFKEPGQQTDGALWALVPKPIDCTYYDMLAPRTDDPFKVQGVKLIYPYHISERINVQKSVFTIQDDPKTPLEEYKWDSRNEEDVDVTSLIRWKIKSSSMPEIVADLERVDINKHTLFPDFDGLAGGLLESEIIKKAEV